MKKITLEEHFISPAYAQHVRELQYAQAAGGDHQAGKKETAEIDAVLCQPR